MFQMMECFRLNGLLERTTPVDMQTVFSFSYPSTFSTLLSFCIIYRTLPRDGVKKSKTIMISRFFMRTKLHSPHTFSTNKANRAGDVGMEVSAVFSEVTDWNTDITASKDKDSHCQPLTIAGSLFPADCYKFLSAPHCVFFARYTPVFFCLFLFFKTTTCRPKDEHNTF